MAAPRTTVGDLTREKMPTNNQVQFYIDDENLEPWNRYVATVPKGVDPSRVRKLVEPVEQSTPQWGRNPKTGAVEPWQEGHEEVEPWNIPYASPPSVAADVAKSAGS